MPAGLPDLSFIRRQIPIAEVAEALGIRLAGRHAGHCWRVGSHQNGDRTPSLSFHRNRAKCFVCDADSKTPVDLVMLYQECGLKEATNWICARWAVPSIAKNTKLSRPERWKTSPVGVSSFPLEVLVRSGVWASLSDADRAILPALFCFSENGEVSISYRGLARYAGKTSNTTIAKALRHFEQIGLLIAVPKTSNNFRDVGRYRFTPDSSRFQAVVSTIGQRMRGERDAERTLRAQMRDAAKSTQNPKHSYPESKPLSTTVDCEIGRASCRERV